MAVARALTEVARLPGESPAAPVAANSMLAAAESSLATARPSETAGTSGCGASASSSAECGDPRSVGESSSPAVGGYDGWGNLTPYLAQSPSPRWGASMVYDDNASDGYVVLFGGEGPHGALGDTWIFQNGNWTNVTPSVPTATNTPSPRFGAAMAYDSSDGYVVLFGGASGPLTGSNDPALNDTWEFLHGSWTPLCSACMPGISEPGARFDGSASNDPGDSGVLLFGGLTVAAGSYVPLNDTWVFSAGIWTQFTPTSSPAARYSAGLTVASSSGPVVLFGGCARSLPTSVPNCAAPLGDSWTWASGAWSSTVPPAGSPSARTDFGFTFSAADDLDLAYGGLGSTGVLNETWELADGSWTDLTDSLISSPSPRDDVSLAYDSASGAGYFLLFGGWNGTYLDQSWVYPSPFSPLRVTPLVATPSVVDANHPIRFNVTILGGTGPYHVTWFGLPAGCPSVNASVLVCHFGQPPTNPGFYTVSLEVRDAQGSIVWSTPVTVQVNYLPTVVISSTQANVGIVPWSVTFVASVSGGTAPFTYSWDFGDGTTNGSGNPVTHEYSIAGNYTVTVVANDSFGETALARYRAFAASPLAVELIATPNSTVVGTMVRFAVQVSGGFPPYSYVWSGLPSTCPGVNNASLSCRAASAGTYDVTVRVADSIDDSLTVAATLVVRSTPGASPWTAWLILVAGGGSLILAGVWAGRRPHARDTPPGERAAPPGGTSG